MKEISTPDQIAEKHSVEALQRQLDAVNELITSVMVPYGPMRYFETVEEAFHSGKLSKSLPANPDLLRAAIQSPKAHKEASSSAPGTTAKRVDRFEYGAGTHTSAFSPKVEKK